MVRKAGHRNLQMRYTVFKPETAVHCPLDLLFWLRNLAISVLLLRRTQVIAFREACVGSREWKMLRSVVLQYSETKTVSSGIQGIYAETIYRQNPLYS